MATSVPCGGEERGRRVAQLVPAAAGNLGAVHEAVESLVEGGVRGREAAADRARAVAVALQDLPEGLGDGEPEPGGRSWTGGA